MQWKPNVTVAAIIERGSAYLMVEEIENGRRVYNQPAGHLERGESLIDAVRREVLEETARTFTPEGIVGLYQFYVPGTRTSYLRVAFCGSVAEPIAGRALDTGIITTHWMTRADLQAQAGKLRSPMVLGGIDDYLNTEPLPLDYLHCLSLDPLAGRTGPRG
jgi:ADP-ribose pyrophosphatase YjhB (NUDIX family)